MHKGDELPLGRSRTRCQFCAVRNRLSEVPQRPVKFCVRTAHDAFYLWLAGTVYQWRQKFSRLANPVDLFVYVHGVFICQAHDAVLSGVDQ